MKQYYISTEKATAFVETNDNGYITLTAPIWKRFKGQHIDNLIRWLKNPTVIEYKYNSDKIK